VNYFDQGTGPAVLLIHAFPLNHTMWEPQIGPLLEDFRVIAPDIRGFGGSQPATAWTTEEMADDLRELLDKLDITDCAVVGVSMGGYIAFSFWARHSRYVRQLVLSNTRARADSDKEKAARNEMIAALEQNGAAILPDRMLPRLLKPNPNPEAVARVRAMIAEASTSAATYAVMAMRDRPDSSSLLYRVGCPTLVITGEEDTIIRVEDCRAMADAIPGSRFMRIGASGHLSSLENAEQFNRALLEFLRH
jgi:3-oxoadipate enol-lactonase